MFSASIIFTQVFFPENVPESGFNHVFWVLKRTISLKRFFSVPTTHVLVDKKINLVDFWPF